MKDVTECHARLRRLFNITVTPFKADGAFDHAGPARNIERVIGLGFDGILIGGTLSPSTLEQLADIPGVVGVKQGDLSPIAIDQIANRIGGRIRLLCASDLAFLGPMMCGFDGISSA